MEISAKLDVKALIHWFEGEMPKLWHWNLHFIISALKFWCILCLWTRELVSTITSPRQFITLGLPFIFCSALHTHSPLPSPSQEEGKIKFAHTTTNIINCLFQLSTLFEAACIITVCYVTIIHCCVITTDSIWYPWPERGQSLQKCEM